MLEWKLSIDLHCWLHCYRSQLSTKIHIYAHQDDPSMSKSIIRSGSAYVPHHNIDSKINYHDNKMRHDSMYLYDGSIDH